MQNHFSTTWKKIRVCRTTFLENWLQIKWLKAVQCSFMMILIFKLQILIFFQRDDYVTRLVNLTWCLFTLWLIIIDLFLEKGQLFQKRRVGSRISMLWNTILLWYELCREAAVSFTYKKVVTCKHEVSQHNRTISNCTKIPSVPHIESEKANLIFWNF